MDSNVDVRQPLILVTNDDGIEARGLWAAVEAVLTLGEVLVVAPDRQWSGGGRSMPPSVTGALLPASRSVSGVKVTAFSVDASPALTVVHGVVELAPRPISLVVSGINFGPNLSTEVTTSGTVGAALEGGAFGIPSLAVSLDMDSAFHLTGDESTDYGAAMFFTRQFAEYLLTVPQPQDVDALNLNIPAHATPSSAWRFTRLSRFRYFLPSAPDRALGQGRPQYSIIPDPNQTEPDSDIHAVGEGVVSVTPLSLDMTSRVHWQQPSSSLAEYGLGQVAMPYSSGME